MAKKFIAEYVRRDGNWAGIENIQGDTKREVMKAAKRGRQKDGRHRMINIWTENYRTKVWKNGSWTSDAKTHFPS